MTRSLVPPATSSLSPIFFAVWYLLLDFSASSSLSVGETIKRSGLRQEAAGSFRHILLLLLFLMGNIV